MSTATYPLLRVFSPYSSLGSYKGYFIGACPICNGTPAKMVVRPDQGSWHCYSCGAGGDAIDFLQAVEQLSRDQAYLLYKVLIRDDSPASPTVGAPATVLKESTPVAEPPPASVASPPPEPPELPETTAPASAPTPIKEAGSVGELRRRLAAVEGFRGVAYFGTNGKALLVDNMKAEELTAINGYFDGAFRAAQALLGAAPDQSVEGVLQDDGGKFLRLDAPVAGSRCRVFLALGAGASEARFRMVVRRFLDEATRPPA